ncbi:hypothetical protein INR49_007339 [Caranx melampygus]|nr:hypothetical protein INR49_007339 [Caranx melampygus]
MSPLVQRLVSDAMEEFTVTARTEICQRLEARDSHSEEELLSVVRNLCETLLQELRRLLRGEQDQEQKNQDQEQDQEQKNQEQEQNQEEKEQQENQKHPEEQHDSAPPAAECGKLFSTRSHLRSHLGSGAPPSCAASSRRLDT